MLRYMLYLFRQMLQKEEGSTLQDTQGRPKLNTRMPTVVLSSDKPKSKCAVKESAHRCVQICPNCKSSVKGDCGYCPRCGYEINAFYSG